MFKRLFVDHPARCGESYLTHARFALGVSAELFAAAFAALAHAAVPSVCETTASRRIIALYPRMMSRRAQASPTPQAGSSPG